MKKDYLDHLFVPSEKSVVDRISDTVDDKLSRLFGWENSPKRVLKKARDGMILHNTEKK